MRTQGDLAYEIALVCDEYLCEEGLSFSSINEVVGALTCVRGEIERRILAPYEDRKLAKNGEVFTCLNNKGETS